MSVLGYDPRVYYRGRSAIEARSMGIPIGRGEVVFRCNLVTVKDGKMLSYNAGGISTEEAHQLVATLNEKLGSEHTTFHPGVSFRHICKIKGREDTLQAICTPPHDIYGAAIADYLPHGAGSDYLRQLMSDSVEVLRNHAINRDRQLRGDMPATMIWLFWGSGQIPSMPSFHREYGLHAALTSGVDLLKGLAIMADLHVLDIPGVTDGLDNDFTAQGSGALDAFSRYDLVVIHVEAPDEAGHAGSVADKIVAIEKIDSEIIRPLRSWNSDDIRILAMPDHPTPIDIRTHTGDPVPFILWGKGIEANGARAFTEAEMGSTGNYFESAHILMSKLCDVN
jgi:2,3-bisphosphoglycerate-independent phosphoglycerate mutase